MKTYFKIACYVLLSLSFIMAIYCYFVLKHVSEYEKRINQIAHIVIEEGEKIPNLEKVNICMCDSVSSYNIAAIRDTISENIAISDKIAPCEVTFDYFLANGKHFSLKADSFNCHGCSGVNIYTLCQDSVHYVYHP